MKFTLLLILSFLQIHFNRFPVKWRDTTVAQLICTPGVYSLCLPINIYHLYRVKTLPYTKLHESESNFKTKRRIYERQAENIFRQCHAVLSYGQDEIWNLLYESDQALRISWFVYVLHYHHL